MKLFADGFAVYRSQFLSVILLSFTIVFPLLLFHSVLSNFVYATTSNLESSAFGDFTNAFLTLLFLVVGQLPFIQYTLSDRSGSEQPLKDSYSTFLYRGFSVYVFGLLYCLIVLTGMVALIVPGIILLVLLFLTPYISVVKEMPLRRAWRFALRFGRKYFFKLLALIALTGIIELLIELVAMIGMSYVTSEYLVILLSQILLNVFLFPLVVIVITTHVLEWKEKSWL
ncbi:hypothetical protein J31TS4_44710 [Paenibacillus sp. J31TS4]|uniref:hypothetical protein n=1 Tax=Paenibacillus sp. J31TS4 TaxID=2807195 RepID=UPI001B022E77|nr:hypothetical protein [Paenibacillus sp. J31TS4]GIP41191.1 hypothetical protein J31TS4_44710 [Paenibacillus sp. J31TS4]